MWSIYTTYSLLDKDGKVLEEEMEIGPSFSTFADVWGAVADKGLKLLEQARLSDPFAEMIGSTSDILIKYLEHPHKREVKISFKEVK